MFMKRCILCVLCAFIVFALAAAGIAYILPAKQVLTFMIGQLGSCRSLIVSQKTVIYEPGLEGGMQEFVETLYYGYPDRFRSEVSTSELEQIRVVNHGHALVVIDGRVIGETEDQFDHFKDLFLYREIDFLVDRLCQLGINLEIVSLGRFKDEIAYVIGAKYPDESVPQVWVNKNTFRPIRLILNGNDGEDTPLKEIEYTDYRPLGKRWTYPGRILFFESGTLVKMQVLETSNVNPGVPEQLFDVAYLKSVSEPMTSTKPTPLPGSELNDVKKSIQDFKKVFE